MFISEFEISAISTASPSENLVDYPKGVYLVSTIKKYIISTSKTINMQ
jgi:hypothetical protein